MSQDRSDLRSSAAAAAAAGSGATGGGLRRRLILVTGLLRRPELFLRSLKEWRALIREGHCDGIIVSTWRGELASVPEVGRELGALDATVIESIQPEVTGVGNIWPQMLAFEKALDASGPASVVLKTRSDVRLTPAIMKWLLSGECLSVPPRCVGGRTVFDQRVWVPWFIPAVPFFLGDEVFAGTPSDLRRLVNSEISYDRWADSAPGSAHLRRFHHSFRECCPIFSDFLWYLWAVEGEPNLPYISALPRLVESACYLEALAAYFLVLHRQFAIGAPVGSIEADLWCSPSPANRPRSDLSLLGALSTESRTGSRWAIHRDVEWLDQIVNGRIAAPAALVDALKRFSGAESPWESARAKVEWEESSSNLRNAVADSRDRGFENGFRGRVFGGVSRRALRAVLRGIGCEEPARRLRSRLRRCGWW